jgi:UTP--glucose-1-phosphate uridylyltransferase
MRVVIPAAGLGTRFAPLNTVLPKELLPLGNRPLIHHALDEAALAGFDQAVIVVSPAKHEIRRYFETMGEPADIAHRLHLTFAEQVTPAGLGDAVLQAAGLASPGPIAVLLPDDVVPSADHWARVLAAHRSSGGAALCVRRVDWEETHRFGIAVCTPEGDHLRVRGLVEKPAHGSVSSNLSVFGRYIVTDAVLEALSLLSATARGELQLTDGFAAVVDSQTGVVAVEFADEIYDCGTPDEYARSLIRYGQRNGAQAGERGYIL